MSFYVRTSLAFLSSCLVAIIAAGCGGDGRSPLHPSQTGAVIAGTITGPAGSASTASAGSARTIRPADSSFTGLTVTVVGSNLSTVVDANGHFQISGVSGGTVRLQFTGNGINATITLNNVSGDQFIEIQIQVSGSSVEIVDELRTGKVSLCHAEGNGTYHQIDVSESSEPAHRDHGDAEIGEPVPGRPFMIFDANCRPEGPSVEIEKTTNGGDGLEIVVGTPITWTYIVTNTGTVTLTGIVVTDSKGVAVSCPATSLTAGNSTTCTGSGAAVAGPYSNIGTVVAGFTFNTTTSHRDRLRREQLSRHHARGAGAGRSEGHDVPQDRCGQIRDDHGQHQRRACASRARRRLSWPACPRCTGQVVQRQLRRAVVRPRVSFRFVLPETTPEVLQDL